MKQKVFYLITLFFSTVLYAQAQTITVSGTVTEKTSGMPAIGVSVVVLGTPNGTITDIDGKYSLNNIPANASLQFSYVGMKNQTIPVNNRKVINISLEDDTKSLEEVVVVGYGTQKVKDLTAPIAVVKKDVFEKQATTNPMQALQGKVAGVQVINSGAPGAGPAVRIRGVGSIGDYAKPLYVVDGVFVDNIDFLNNNDIETMNVLKDASASAIYGVRAANGVIIVTTKRGTKGTPTITYDGYFAMQVPVNIMKLANTSQYVTLRNEVNKDEPGYTPLTVEQFNGANTDWYDVLLHNAPMYNQSLDVSGGNEISNYSLGINYLYQDGILDVDNNYSRLNLRGKGEYQLSKSVKAGFSTVISNYTHNKPNNDAFFQAYINPSIYNVYDENNTQAYPVKFGSPQIAPANLGNSYGNPYAVAYYQDDLETGYQIIPSMFLEIGFLKDKLRLKTQYNMDLRFIMDRNYRPENLVGGSQGLSQSELVKRYTNYTKQIWDNTLTYSDVFDKKHNYSVMLGNSIRHETNPWLQGTAINVPGKTDSEKYIRNGSANDRKSDDDNEIVNGLSYFLRGTYNYDSKYLATLTVRADGSSKYQQKWGYFPSIGLGWVMSAEDFMTDQKILDYLKVRASWGQLGNDNVPANSSYIVGTAGIPSSGVFGDKLVDGVGAQTVLRNYLKWEVVTEFDLGVDFTLLHNRLSGTLDFYRRVTSDVVFNAPIASGGGTAELLGNNGTVQNMGVEFSLNWNDKIGEDFNYNAGLNLSTVNNKVTEVSNRPDGKVPGTSVNGMTATYAIVGKPIGSFYGYDVLGIYQTTAETKGTSAEPGYFKYRNDDGDGNPDIVYLGSPTPKLMGGIDLGAGYKRWDFSIAFQGQWGNKILNQKRMKRETFPAGNYDEAFYENRWTGNGSTNEYPSAKAYNASINQKPNSFFVEDGSYIRIQNVQLGYTIPKAKDSKLPLIRLYVLAQRPLTIFGYNGFTTEISGEPNSTGIDNNVYPMQAVYSVGARLTF